MRHLRRVLRPRPAPLRRGQARGLSPAAAGERALSARLRGISPKRHSHIDLADLAGLDGHPRAYVEFSHPLCAECREWEQHLSGEPEPLVKLDVRERPDLARKYGIAVVPTVLAVGPDGAVLERLAP